MNPFWITVADPKAWKRQQKFVAIRNADGKTEVVCNICRTTPEFMGWCSGAASYLCNCALDESFNDGRGY